jgi:hypothetical protein
MDPIGGLDRLTELIRRKTAETGTAAEKSAAAKGASGEQNAAAQQRPTAAVFEQQIQAKIRQMQQAAAAPAALRRVVIEAMLAWEFRSDLHNEPKFAALINRVQGHIESEPDVLQAFEKLVKQLSK